MFLLSLVVSMTSLLQVLRWFVPSLDFIRSMALELRFSLHRFVPFRELFVLITMGQVVTMPPDIFDKMYDHILTDAGMEIFEKDLKLIETFT